MKTFDTLNSLIAILQISQDKHGENYPLTIGHFLNIAKLLDKRRTAHSEADAEDHRRCYNEAME